MLRTSRIFAILLAAGIILAGCNGTPLLPASPTPEATQPPVATNTPLPPPTDTPVPKRLILVTGSGSSADLLDPARVASIAAAQAAGIQFEEREALLPADLTPDMYVVVFLSAPEDLPSALSTAPATQFVVVSANDLPAASNLTVLRTQATHQAFIAGMIAVLLSDDWRAAGMIPSESPDLQGAFQNGGRYFCGTCAPGWPLGLNYPIIGSIPAADSTGWLASATDLFDNGKAEVYYLSPAAATPEVLAYLNGRVQFETLIRLVGSGPPPAGLEAQWAASVGFDLSAPLQQALTAAMAGQSSGSVTVPVQVTNINPDLLSPGRVALVNSAMADLAVGLINPDRIETE
jgi:hypothetical protein